jgi:hypothetical protein
MAPEVLAQPSAEEAATMPPSWLASYNEKADIWGVGVLVLEALTGCAPFAHANPDIAALKARFGAPPPLPAGTSAACADFVRAALTQDPARRPSAAELLAHPWISRAAPAGAAEAPAAAAAPPRRPLASPFAAGSLEPASASGSQLGASGSSFSGSLARSSSVGSFPMSVSVTQAQRTPVLPVPSAAAPLRYKRPLLAPSTDPAPCQRQPSMGVGMAAPPPLQNAQRARPRRCSTAASLVTLAEGPDAPPARPDGPAVTPFGSMPTLPAAAAAPPIVAVASWRMARGCSLPVPIREQAGGPSATPSGRRAAVAAAMSPPALTAPLIAGCPAACPVASAPNAGGQYYMHAWAGAAHTARPALADPSAAASGTPIPAHTPDEPHRRLFVELPHRRCLSPNWGLLNPGGWELGQGHAPQQGPDTDAGSAGPESPTSSSGPESATGSLPYMSRSDSSVNTGGSSANISRDGSGGVGADSPEGGQLPGSLGSPPRRGRVLASSPSAGRLQDWVNSILKRRPRKGSAPVAGVGLAEN